MSWPRCHKTRPDPFLLPDAEHPHVPRRDAALPDDAVRCRAELDRLARDEVLGPGPCRKTAERHAAGCRRRAVVEEEGDRLAAGLQQAHLERVAGDGDRRAHPGPLEETPEEAPGGVLRLADEPRRHVGAERECPALAVARLDRGPRAAREAGEHAR